MAKKRCIYVLLSLCILGFVLGIVLVLVLIKLLLVPLRGNLRPMSQNCLVVDISPVVADSNPELKPVRTPKIAKRPDLENEILAKNEISSYEKEANGRRNCRKLGNNVTCLTDSEHRTRHVKNKIRHRLRNHRRDSTDTVQKINHICYTVRVQFLVETLEPNNGISSLVKEGYLRQTLDVADVKEGLLRIQKDNISFCCGCQSKTSNSSDTNNTELVYLGGKLRNGQNILCDREIVVHMASRTKRTNWLLLNAMFWPTLMFVFGFVGLFFIGIRLVKANAKKVKTANVRTPLQRFR